MKRRETIFGPKIEGKLATPTRVVIDAANRTLTVDGIDMTDVVDEVVTSTTPPFVTAVTLHLPHCDVVMITEGDA